jgi:hypothetical protein
LIEFIKIEFGRIGADTNITPREVIRDFIEVLNIMHQNPKVEVSELLGLKTFAYARPELQDEAPEKEFEEFEL